MAFLLYVSTENRQYILYLNYIQTQNLPSAFDKMSIHSTFSHNLDTNKLVY